MRPPVLPSGNTRKKINKVLKENSFNEAAGFTQRKLSGADVIKVGIGGGFNEAAGFTQRKRMYKYQEKLDKKSCFNEAAGFTQRKPSRWTTRT